jgi:hypothetical protein
VAGLPVTVTGKGALHPRLKRLLFWQLTLLPTYAGVSVLLFLLAMLEATKRGPYSTWYNQRMSRKAAQASLVGAPESRVVAVLGRPDDVMGAWDQRKGETGPHRIAVYQYYPYPLVPLAKFRVHCAQGVVRNVETFGDR